MTHDEEKLERYRAVVARLRKATRFDNSVDGADMRAVLAAFDAIESEAPAPHDACPFCGSIRLPIETPGDEVFCPRRGCLDCDNWWDAPRLRK